MIDYKTFDVLVIGSGAAGFNAANTIKKLNKKSVAIITEDINCGTSRNTGSDKQTYYKLGLASDNCDSVRKMANDLFNAGSTDGDTALCEAALSAKCFYNLCSLGVDFPCNRYGEYIGYKTDHDPSARATSAGPLTSHYMTKALETQAKELNVDIFDGYTAVEILKKDDRVCGLMCIHNSTAQPVFFRCTDIIMCTGGPAGIYSDSVYPSGHTGSTGLAIRAGASMQNMTEWQYGLASIKPRWNVSGTYMQCLPCFVSIDSDGNEYEFLTEYFDEEYSALSEVFLKGYQWPFDCEKIIGGSSVIDLLVYRETAIRKRRVYLDFRKNPFGFKEIDFSRLDDEAYGYLKKLDADFGTPIERLEHMNSPAVELYRSKGVDLYKQRLEIAICAQHHNGGIAVNHWWQSSIEGLFAAGECAGTHGTKRPGGSALNSGQAGSVRAAQFISAQNKIQINDDGFQRICSASLAMHNSFTASVMSDKSNVDFLMDSQRKKMSKDCSIIRDKQAMLNRYSEINFEELRISDAKEIVKAYKFVDMSLVQKAVLFACIDYAEKAALSRGSCIYCSRDGLLPDGLDESFRFYPYKNDFEGIIQEIVFKNNTFEAAYRKVRPIPDEDNAFETVWKEYRKNKNVY